MNITPMLSAETIAERVRALGAQISADYADKRLTVLCVLTGSFLFTADLVRALDIPCEIRFLRASSYVGTCSSGAVKLEAPLCDLAGRDVLITEDIIDTGITLQAICEDLKAHNPASLRICALLDKPARRNAAVTIRPDYVGFPIEDRFVVGYGMDYNEQFRALPYIGELHPKAEKEGSSAL